MLYYSVSILSEIRGPSICENGEEAGKCWDLLGNFIHNFWEIERGNPEEVKSFKHPSVVKKRVTRENRCLVMQW